MSGVKPSSDLCSVAWVSRLASWPDFRQVWAYLPVPGKTEKPVRYGDYNGSSVSHPGLHGPLSQRAPSCENTMIAVKI